MADPRPLAPETTAAHHVGRTGPGSRHPDPAGGAVAHSSSGRPTRSTARSSAEQQTATHHSGWVLVVGLGGLAFALAAVALEILSGSYANSSVPGWAAWVPLAWPQPLRVAWWLLVAAAAASFRRTLGQLGMRPNRVVTALTVGPFVVFAAAIGIGADWATWH